jgi:hypothetical protein
LYSPRLYRTYMGPKQKIKRHGVFCDIETLRKICTAEWNAINPVYTVI